MAGSRPLLGGIVWLMAIWARAMVMSFLKCGSATVTGRGFILEGEGYGLG